MNPRILVLAFASFAVGTETYVFAGLLARLAADLQVSIAAAGQLSSAFALVFAVSAPITAVLVARLDRKRVLVAALCVLGVLNVIAALMPVFGGLLAVRVLCGLTATLVNPVAAAAATAMVPMEQRGKALAVVLGGMTLAFLVGIPLGTVIGDFFTWRGSFVFSGMLALIAALIIGRVLPAVPSGDQPGFGVLRVALQGPVFRNLLLTVMAFTAMFCVIAFIGPVVTLISGLEGSSIGVMQAMVGIGSILGVAIGGRLADRANSHLAIACCVGLIGVTLVSYSALMINGVGLGETARRVLLAVMIMTGAGSLFAMTPAIQARLIMSAPTMRNVVLALNASMIFLGQGLGALIGGVTVAASGLPMLGLAGAAIAGLAVLLAVTRGHQAPSLAEPERPA